MEQRYTIKNLRKKFGTERECLEYLFNQKNKDIKHCPTCGLYTKFYLVEHKKRYVTICGHSIFPTSETIFYKSSTPLTLWFHAIFLFSVLKNGVSAKEIEKQLGVTYKTAWRMTNKIRSLMNEKVQMVSGIVEMDETYVGEIEKNKHKNKKSLAGFVDKDPIVRMKLRNEKIIANVENNTWKTTLFKNIYNHISMNNLIITNELPAYKEVSTEDYWMHKKINHNFREYARIKTIDKIKINTSTNVIENFWGVFKRDVKEAYIRLSKKHMQSYVNEFSWRFNNNDKVLFRKLIGRI